jgi:alpha-amylase
MRLASVVAWLGLVAAGCSVTVTTGDGGTASRDCAVAGAADGGGAGAADDGSALGSDLAAGGDGGAIANAAEPVILQLFDWPFAAITAELPLVAAVGYTHIHVSPPMLSNPTTAWWGRYQPVDYRVIDGPLGDESAFAAMTAAARAYGVAIVVDVVFNHMANLGADAALTFPPPAAQLQSMYGNSYPQLTSSLFTSDDFHAAFCISDYTNAQEVRDGRICGGSGDTGLPDLRQTNDDGSLRQDVLAAQSAYLQHLLALGVGGFRFDAIKHMEPKYFPALLGSLPAGLFLLGESIVGNDQPGWDADVTPYLTLGLPLRLYDFPLVNTLRSALATNGNLGALLAAGASDRTALPLSGSVAFVLNHDIPQDPEPNFYMGSCTNSQSWGDPVNERLAYAFVLGRAGSVPYVYSDRGKAGNDGVASDAYRNAHRRCDLARMVRFHALTSGWTQATITSAARQIVWQRGTQAFVAVNADVSAWHGGGQSSLADGRYVDLIGGGALQVTGGVIPSFTVAAHDTAMYVSDAVYTDAVAASVAALACEPPQPPACDH